jgi:hypothetical protein
MHLGNVDLKSLGRAKEGTLADTPFPWLLQALFLAERTVVIELKKHHLEKRVFLEEGVPVDCESNLLHETCGKVLVERNKLDEQQYQRALTEAALAGERMEQTLLRLQLVAPFELFKVLQQNLAFKILDCFCASWSDAKFRVLSDPGPVAQPLRVNLVQLIFTGVCSFTPPGEVERALKPWESEPLALTQTPPHPRTQLKSTPKEARLLNDLRRGATMEELEAKKILEPDDLRRRVYALGVLGFLDTAERVAEQITPAAAPEPARPPTPAAVPVVAPAAAPPAPAGLSPAEVDKLRNDVTAAYLVYRSRDAFDLLGLKEDHTAAQLRDAYLGWAERFAPWRYAAKGAEPLAPFAEKARDLFLAGARAFGELSGPETRAAVLRRRAAARDAATRHRSTDFSIKTNLLDARQQHQEGMARLEAGDAAAAIPFLEFAADCDPRQMLYRVHLAYASFLAAPRTAEAASLAELEEAFRIDPTCGEALLRMGQLHLRVGRYDRAEDAAKKAAKLLLGDRRVPDLLKQIAQEKARGK